MFQFTHPCGCDWDDWEILTLLDVSIHAPVWVRQARARLVAQEMEFQFTHPCGCDGPLIHLITVNDGFNSRTRVGATRLSWTCGLTHRFQFTHPCGCDRTMHGQTLATGSFNSRTRVGATGACLPHNLKPLVSIHAPVWVRRPDEYGLSIKHATKVLRQPDARTGCGQA